MMSKLTIATSVTLVLLFSKLAFASNISTGNIKNKWQPDQALARLKSVEQPAASNEKTGKTRAQVLELIKHSKVNNKTLLGKNQPQKSASIYHNEFNIYQGYAQLIEDYDEDGFYQTFSVTFDADVYSHDIVDQALVYGELYLSKNGGDWVHYFTTDNFFIYGESEDDQYEVYTTLNQGYVPSNYDVLIDLYEVGYSDIVATYSSDDTNELYALPLESSDYDPDYIEPHSDSHGHGGSSSILMLMLLSIALWVKRKF